MKKTIILLFTFFLAYSTLFAQSWTELNSGTFENFQDVQFLNSDTGYVTGDFGMLFKSTDGGNSWQLVQTGSCPAYYQFSSTKTGYSFSNDSIIKTTEGGLSCNNIHVFTPVSPTGIFVLNDTTCLVGGINYFDSQQPVSFMKTSDGGMNWSESVIPGINFSGFETMFFTNALNGVALLGNSISKTTDGGANWIPASTSTDVFDLHFPTTNIGYGCSWGLGIGSVSKTTDGGANWNVITQVNYDLFSIFFTSADTGFAVGGNQTLNTGIIIKTTDGGATWDTSYTTNHFLMSIDFPNASTGYAAGTNGTILKYSTTNGIEKSSDSRLVTIYPNPASTNFTVETNLLNSTTIQTEIKNTLGQIIYTSSEKVSNGLYKKTIDLNLGQGLYFLTLQTNDGLMTKKIEVVK